MQTKPLVINTNKNQKARNPAETQQERKDNMQTKSIVRPIRSTHWTTGAVRTALAGLILGLLLPVFGQAPSAQNYTIRTLDVPVANKAIDFNYLNNSGL